MISSDKTNSLFEKITTVWLSALVISQVLFPKLVSIWIVIGVLHTIYGIGTKQRKFQFSWISVGFASLYLFYLIGIFFSENLSLGLSYLEYKLSFLLFAFIFCFPPRFFNWKIISLIFICAVLIAVILGFGNSWIKLNDLPELGLVSSFTGVYFSYIHHPSYFAVYIFLAALLLFKIKSVYFSGRLNPVFWFVLLLFFIAYLATISLAAYLFLVGFIFIYALKLIFKSIPSPYSWFSILILPIIFYVIIWSIPTIKFQIKSSIHYFSEFLNDPQTFLNSKNGEVSGDETRIIMWTVTVEEIAANPFGVGTGSVDQHLSNRLKSHGLSELAEMDNKNTITYNPHNQYLQLCLELGIQGLILFLFLLFYLVRKAILEKNWVLFFLVISLVFNSLFESVLQRQSGIIFYTFFLFFMSIFNFQTVEKDLLIKD